MKIALIVIGIILAIGLTLYLVKGKSKSDQVVTSPKVYHPKDNAFEGLRSMAFSTTPERLGISLPNDKTIVYGVIMDWEMGDGIATTVSYQTGEASLYLSTGGGVIGGGQHQNVNDAAKQFVNLAQTYLNKAIKTEATPLPEKDEVKFYLLTNKGIYFGKEVMMNFENNSSIWLGLFEEGNKVLTELRLTSEK